MRGHLALVALGAGCSFQGGATPAAGEPGKPDARIADAVVHDAPAKDAATDAPMVMGALTITMTTMGTQDIDLSGEGTLDWAHWGLTSPTSFDHKSGGNLISNLAATPALNFGGAPLTSSWTDGTPHVATSHTTSGVGTHQGATMQFTLPADITTHTLRVYAGVQQADAHIEASLSDNSAPAVSKDISDPNGTTNYRFTITFNAAGAGKTLTIKITDTNDHGSGGAFDALLSATLQ